MVAFDLDVLCGFCSFGMVFIVFPCFSRMSHGVRPLVGLPCVIRG